MHPASVAATDLRKQPPKPVLPGSVQCIVGDQVVNLYAYNCYQVSPATAEPAESLLHLHMKEGEAEVWLEISLNGQTATQLPVLFAQKKCAKSSPFKGFYMPAGRTRAYFVSNTGRVTITHYDPVKQFVSGTFEFTGRKFDPADPLREFPEERIKISEGKFELIHFRND
jgi:hypothetical protein